MINEIRVTIEPDDDGMVGRECPNSDCGRYFKLKLGTGLPTTITRCPYCEVEGEQIDFMTADQVRYVQTVGAKKILDPIFDKFSKNMKRLSSSQGGSLLQLKVSVGRSGIKLHNYQEKQLETVVICDNCSLEFAVYGVFASCPDCRKLNALKVCLASFETAKKKLLLSQDEKVDLDLRRDFVQDTLGGAVDAFDAYGKALRTRRKNIRASAKTNLFQDIEALNTELQAAGVPCVEQIIGTSAWEDMKWFFQARHIYTHNAGVVDARFVSKQPSYLHMLGRLLPLDADRIGKNIDALGQRLLRNST